MYEREKQTVKIKNRRLGYSFFFFNICLEIFYYAALLKQRMLQGNVNGYIVNP